MMRAIPAHGTNPRTIEYCKEPRKYDWADAFTSTTQAICRSFLDASSQRIAWLSSTQEPNRTAEIFAMRVCVSSALHSTGDTPPPLSDHILQIFDAGLSTLRDLKGDSGVGPAFLLLQQLLLSNDTDAKVLTAMIREFWAMLDHFGSVSREMVRDLKPNFVGFDYWKQGRNLHYPVIFSPSWWMIEDEEHWGRHDCTATPIIYAVLHLLARHDCDEMLKQHGHTRDGIVAKVVAFCCDKYSRSDFWGRTPIHVAARLGLVDVVTGLVDRKPDVCSQKDSFDRTPLHGAALSGSTELCRILLGSGACIDINAAEQRMGFTALHNAVAKGQRGIIRLLLEQRLTDPNIDAHPYGIPLSLAISHSPEVYDEFLARSDVDFEITDVEDNSLLHQVLSEVNDKDLRDEMLQKLIPRCAGVINSLDSKHRTALCLAAQRNVGPGVIRAFLSVDDIRADIPDNMGMTPLHHAAEEGNVETCRLLCVRVDSGILSPDEDGEVPLEIARNHAHVEVIQILENTHSSVRLVTWLGGREAGDDEQESSSSSDSDSEDSSSSSSDSDSQDSSSSDSEGQESSAENEMEGASMSIDTDWLLTNAGIL